MQNEFQTEIQQLESAIAETKKGIQKCEQWMREGNGPVDIEIARIRLHGMKKSLLRMQSDQ
jgi:hypothetical protein